MTAEFVGHTNKVMSWQKLDAVTRLPSQGSHKRHFKIAYWAFSTTGITLSGKLGTRICSGNAKVDFIPCSYLLHHLAMSLLPKIA